MYKFILQNKLSSRNKIKAEDEVKVLIDGKTIEFDVSPSIINDRVMVPMRTIFENIGATVDWDDEFKTAYGSLQGITVGFIIDEYKMLKNTIYLDLDTPATIVNDRTLLPLRAVAESFGMSVSWDGDSRTVYIDTSNNLGYYKQSDSVEYRGELSNGIPYGYGALFHNGDVEFVGRVDGTELVEGTYYYTDGTTYTGYFSNGKPSGQGRKRWTDGSYYEGSFENGYFNGYGEFFYSYYNCSYIGNWVNGRKNGQFTVIDYEFNTSSPAYYIDDEYIGESNNSYNYEVDNQTNSDEAYYNELLDLQEEYQKRLDEINELQIQVNELAQTDPLETEEAKSILSKYNLSNYYGASSNGGNIDSYSAANAMRQQQALYTQAAEQIIKAHNAKIDSLQSQIDELKQLTDDWYYNSIQLLKEKYNINQ